jgi:hypothetical protein
MSVGVMLPPPPPHPAKAMQAAAIKIQPMRFIAIPSSRSLCAASIAAPILDYRREFARFVLIPSALPRVKPSRRRLRF